MLLEIHHTQNNSLQTAQFVNEENFEQQYQQILDNEYRNSGTDIIQIFNPEAVSPNCQITNLQEQIHNEDTVDEGNTEKYGCMNY